MGVINNILTGAVDVYRNEIVPVRNELIKAGLLSPHKASDYEHKSTLVDPFNYQATTYGYKEKYTLIDWSRTRQISLADPVIASIIQTRSNQVGAFAVPQVDKYKTGFKISLRDKRKKLNGASKKKAEDISQFMLQCGYPDTHQDTVERKKRDNFETFLRKIVRDSLTYDQTNFEVVPRNNGLPAEFIAVDASTMRLVPDKRERSALWGGDNKYANNNIDSLAVRPYWTENERTTETKYPRYCQIVQGTPRAWFDEWEMAFGMRNPRTDILSNGYSICEIEMLLTTITAHINADTHNRNYFSNGTNMKGMIAFEGNVPPDQLSSFRRSWKQMSVGSKNAWKTPIINTGKDTKVNWIGMDRSNKDMEWGKYVEYLIKIICGCYQIDPIEIGFDISKNSSGGGSASLGGQGQQVERLKYSKDKGLDPLLRFIASLINEYIVWRIDPDFEFEFVGLNGASEEQQIDLDKKKLESFMTLDELRAEHDLKGLKDAEDMKLGDLVLNPQFIQAYQSMASQGQDGMDGMGQEGMDGQDSGQEDQEPDYANMSTADLEKELSGLKGKKDDSAQKSISQRQRELELIL